MIDTYELATHNIGSIYFIPHDLSYFHTHFICEPMAASWEPPPVQAVRKRAKLADFSSWMLRAPVVRKRVRDILSAYCGNDLEFLPFYTTQRGEQLFAMNVLTTEATKPLFKKDRKSIVYARDEFGILARDHKFTGVALADPNANNLRLITFGQDINVFPGLAR